MFEFSFILPPTHKREVGKSLAENFGGYTAQPVQGGWVDYDGELIEEPMIRFTVAADAAREMQVFGFARDWADVMEQDALYFVGTGGVEIVDLSEAAS